MNSAAHPVRVLLADDEPLFLNSTAELLRQAGFDCTPVDSGSTALAALERRPFDILVADRNMPGNAALELLKEGRRRHPELDIVLITGVPTLHSAIDSVRLGIADYLLKPVRIEDLVQSLRKIASRRPTSTAAASDLREELRFLGNSPAMREVAALIERVAPSDVNVLILGESGTGKELVAQAIHRLGKRRAGKCVTIDCAAIPDLLFESTLFGHCRGSFTGAISDQVGLLELCHQGTAFLDEVGELPLLLQAKLLRVVQQECFKRVGSTQEQQIETRFVSATNRDLEREVQAGRFRQDLFYRLAVVQIALPPLRQRGDDILLLAHRFLEDLRPPHSPVERFSRDALEFLTAYPWPGNVRELRNVIERALVLARTPELRRADLEPPSWRRTQSELAEPEGTGGALSSRLHVLGNAEREYLENLLRQCNGNVSRAAEQAGLTRQGLYKLLDKHGLSAAAFRTPPG